MPRPVHRRKWIDAIRWRFTWAPVVALLGPRQVGKSTLARAFARTCRGPVHHFDLERPEDVRRLTDDRIRAVPLARVLADVNPLA